MSDDWLKRYGYTSIALPRRNLAPGDVLLRGDKGRRDKGGTLADLVSNDQPLPEIVVGETVADLTRTEERTVEVSFGLKLLGALFGGGTTGDLGADTEFRRAKRLVITYEGILLDSFAVLALQNWLHGATVTAAPSTQVLLNDEKLAAVTAVLRSKTISVIAEDASGTAIELSIPQIQGVVGGGATVKATSESRTKVTFEGSEPIVFAVQAFVMRYEGNVSFGLEQDRGALRSLAGAPGREFGDQADTPEQPLERVDDVTVPVG
ncbi:MAG TPA: hypothetical protein VLK58_21355 [Conexibacter sp.]|nr:hypothetical protein [Conexibacter sp.]